VNQLMSFEETEFLVSKIRAKIVSFGDPSIFKN
jgi:hypothetical protein